jgi:hypothetical protein
MTQPDVADLFLCERAELLCARAFLCKAGWTNVAFANLILNSVAHPQQISGIVQLQPRE